MTYVIEIIFLISELHIKPGTPFRAAEHNYDVDIKTSFPLSVKGCREAIVTLWSNREPMYEIKLGTYYNRRSTLRKVGRSGWPVTHWKPTLDCKKVIPFYISWGNGKVQVGKGKDEILSLYDNPVPPIDDVTVEAGSDELFLIIEEGMSVCQKSLFTFVVRIYVCIYICRTYLCVYIHLPLMGISNVHLLTPTFFIKAQNWSSCNNT